MGALKDRTYPPPIFTGRSARSILHFALCTLQFVIIFFSFWAVLLFASSAWAAEEWKQAVGPRTWNFPRDHGAHPEYRTEWWYFTGNLADEAGARFGYQLTFFRQAVAPEEPGAAPRGQIPVPKGPVEVW